MDIDAQTLGALRLKQKDSSGRALLAVATFILGGIIGAGVALLFSPAVGPWRRKGTWDRVDEAKEALVMAAHGQPVLPVPASEPCQPAKSV
jgi:hypothetical protein